VIQQATLATKELQFKVTDEGLLIKPIEQQIASVICSGFILSL
jgi:hypothetical protein